MFEIHEPIVYYKTSEDMSEIKNEAIQLIITSPPYGKIKDYGSENQIGFYDESFEDYFNRLTKVWEECYRILEPQCRLIINIGDQYLRTSEFGRYRILSIASRIIKDCLDLGFDFLGDIIWQKISTTNTTGGCSLMGSIFYPRNGLLTFDYEHVLIFKKYKGKKRIIPREIKEMSKIPLSEWKTWYVGHWEFPGIIQKEHIAMFPEELPHRLIRMFSYIGDTILDPFAGSGTTLKVAKTLFRKSIGYELNEQYKQIIERKIKEGKVGLFKDFQYLLYLLYQKSLVEDFYIKFEAQKQKGITLIENQNEQKIIIDYLMSSENVISQEEIDKEIKSKLNENTIINYFEEKNEWKNYECYFIVFNSNEIFKKKTVKMIEDILTQFPVQNRPLSFISYKKITSDEFKITELFDNLSYSGTRIKNKEFILL